MRVQVQRVEVPAYSTLGYGQGTDMETGNPVRFVGDHRPMRDIAEALAEGEDPVIADVPEWALA